MLHAVANAVNKSADGFGLVAHGLEGCLKFEVHRMYLCGLILNGCSIITREGKARGKESPNKTETGSGWE